MKGSNIAILKGYTVSVFCETELLGRYTFLVQKVKTTSDTSYHRPKKRAFFHALRNILNASNGLGSLVVRIRSRLCARIVQTNPAFERDALQAERLHAHLIATR